MKKIFFTLFLVAALLTISVGSALAKAEKVNLEGEIIAVDEANETITIRTAEEEEFEIHFPEGEFGFTAEDIEALVHVKGELLEDGTILAIWFKIIDGDGDGNGNGDSAYCSGEKETSHPIASKLASKFDKDVEEIMAYFCDGFGFGQIYLALQTELITGVDYGTLLLERSEGKGWGEIWKDLGYQGKPKDKDQDKTPPGQEKDKDKDKTPPGQEKDKDKTSPGQEKDKDKTPPGQEKNKDKNKDE